MRKIFKTVLAAAVLTIGIFYLNGRVSAGLSSAEKSPNEPNFTAAQTTEKLYQINCARCHGADGRGETEAGKLYDAPDISGGRRSRRGIEKVVKNGADAMPAFGKKLSKTQIANLAEYVRKL